MFINFQESNAGYTALAIVCINAGFALNFLGARFFRTAIAACGVFAGGDYVATAVSAAIDGFTEESTYWAAFWIGGVLIWFFAFCNLGMGTATAVFLAGAQATLLILGMASYTGSPSLAVALASCGGVLLAFTALLLASRKSQLVVATSFSGATLFINGVSHFVNHSIFTDSYYTPESNEYLFDRLHSSWWTMTAVTITLFMFGVVIQLALSARNVDSHLEPRNTGNAQTEPEAPQFRSVETPLTANKSAEAHAVGNPVAHA